MCKIISITEEELYIIGYKCRECKNPMKFAITPGDLEKSSDTAIELDKISNVELTFATKNGMLRREN